MNFAKQLRAFGKGFRLKDRDPAFKGPLDRDKAERLQQKQLAQLLELQDRFYAHHRDAVLVILQGMDAAGKDGLIKHVMSGINPAGCEVCSFKAPSLTELDHDYLWRTHVHTPDRGRIGIFNRSYYEEVLVVRVHPEFLQGQRLPVGAAEDPKIWSRRYEDINAFERYLERNGTQVVKFFLHLSKREQAERFLSRIESPAKNWKFSKADLAERQHWDDYQKAFEEMIRHTSTDYAPWYVIPADRKWFARTAVAAILVEVLKKTKPRYPEVSEAHRRELMQIRKLLLPQVGRRATVKR
ncbi:MAG: polyphosphate kinase 2 family protein [Verrucomicrobia bacterium]|nr:polyphosphate kinase 2 family protein [Verrucomicrobiota bacterium]